MAIRSFWKVWTAATASNVGDGVALVAIPLITAELTREPLAVAATTVAVRLPWLVFGPVAGAIVDRADRRVTMIATDLARAGLLAAMAALVAAGSMTLAVLYVAIFSVGVLETLFDGAAMSIVPSLVPVDSLERANGQLFSAQIAANSFAGPALGGALFAVALWVPFGFDAATFFISAWILFTIPGRFRPARVDRRSLWSDVRDGLAFVWREPIIRAFAIGAGTLNLGFTAAAAVLILHAQDNLRLGEVGFGLFLAVAALGGIGGAQAAARIIQAAGRYRSLLAAVVVMAASLALTGMASVPWLSATALASFAFAEEVWNVVSVTYRQMRTPDAMLGRVMNSFRVIAYGTFPLGAIVGGVVAELVEVRAAFYVGAWLMVTPLLLIVFTMSERALSPR